MTVVLPGSSMFADSLDADASGNSSRSASPAVSRAVTVPAAHARVDTRRR
jgi:hypothetical protein